MAAITVTWTGAACFDVQVAGGRFACSTDADCAAGFVCQPGAQRAVCMPLGSASGDLGPQGEPDAMAEVDAPEVDALAGETTDANGGPDATLVPDLGEPPPPGSSILTFSYHQGGVALVTDEEGAEVFDVSAAMDAISAPYMPPSDRALTASRNGEWLVWLGQRDLDDECLGWFCLHLARADLSEVDLVRIGGQWPVHPEESAAVSSDGLTIIFPRPNDPSTDHAVDLYRTRRDSTSAIWQTEELLTGESTLSWNTRPALSPDGTRVVFACADAPYQVAGTSVCVVDVDGSGFEVVVAPDDAPEGFGGEGVALGHPSWVTDDQIVFQADWALVNKPQIWRYTLGAPEPVRVAPSIFEDHAPCVLPGGRIATLYAPGQPTEAQLKVMSPTGETELLGAEGVYLPGVLGCGGPAGSR